MTYATQQDLVTRFGASELAQLTDEAAGVTINTATVAQALVDADAEIDGYLGVRYALPLTSVPALINRLACDIARFYLFDDRVTEAVKLRYQGAVTTLKSLSAGTVTLTDAAGIAPAIDTAGSVRVSARSRDRVFGADLLDSFGRC